MKKMKSYKCKDGTTRYPLPNCNICGKRSNTTDKETAQIAKRNGRICRVCTINIKAGNLEIHNSKWVTTEEHNELHKFPTEYKAEFIEKLTLWQKICRWFK